MIISVAGFKGGIGKTTTAIHLAAYFQTLGNTMLVDADENRSALTWARSGKLPYEVIAENQVAKEFSRIKPEHIVVDTKGRPSPEDIREISKGCDLLILPTTHRSMDLQGLSQTIHAVKPLGAPFYVLLNMVPPLARNSIAQIKELLEGQEIPLFSAAIPKYSFMEQLHLEGTLARDAKDDNAEKVWQQYVKVGEEIIE